MTAPETLPRSFGNYVLLIQLHAGPTGQSFLALPRGGVDKEPWALVKVYAQSLATPAFFKGLADEVSGYRALGQAPGVLPLKEAGRVGPLPYRAAPYFPSKDVQKILT